jgi:hypothetical protein
VDVLCKKVIEARQSLLFYYIIMFSLFNIYSSHLLENKMENYSIQKFLMKLFPIEDIAKFSILIISTALVIFVFVIFIHDWSFRSFSFSLERQILNFHEMKTLFLNFTLTKWNIFVFIKNFCIAPHQTLK